MFLIAMTVIFILPKEEDKHPVLRNAIDLAGQAKRVSSRIDAEFGKSNPIGLAEECFTLASLLGKMKYAQFNIGNENRKQYGSNSVPHIEAVALIRLTESSLVSKQRVCDELQHALKPK